MENGVTITPPLLAVSRAYVKPVYWVTRFTSLVLLNTGPSTSIPVPLVTSNDRVVPALTQGVRTSSEGGFQTTDLAKTSAPTHVSLKTQTLSTKTLSENLTPVGTTSKAETREAQTTFPAMETNALTKVTSSSFMAVITSPVETSVMSSSTMGTGTTTGERSGPTKAISDALFTDDSSEETKRMTADSWISSVDSSVSSNTTSHVLTPDIATGPKALVAYSVTHIELTRDTNIPWATTSGTSDTDHSPTGVQALSTSETWASSTSTESKSHTSKTPASAEALSTASTSESASPDTTPEAPLPTNGTTERETTAAETPSPGGTSVAVSTKPWEETSALSAETTPHVEASRAATHSTEPGSTAGKVTSSAGFTASVYSPSEAATIQNSTPSETFATEGTTWGSFPISRSPLPSVPPTTASSSQETHSSLDEATSPPEPPAATPTTAQTRRTTEVTAGGRKELWAWMWPLHGLLVLLPKSALSRGRRGMERVRAARMDKWCETVALP
uniref:Uncharacterized protein n=1 Tax=Sciurus vulgaris TaxID=55149 RepID=A0A8D2CU47_SCIVU